MRRFPVYSPGKFPLHPRTNTTVGRRLQVESIFNWGNLCLVSGEKDNFFPFSYTIDYLGFRRKVSLTALLSWSNREAKSIKPISYHNYAFICCALSFLSFKQKTKERFQLRVQQFNTCLLVESRQVKKEAPLINQYASFRISNYFYRSRMLRKYIHTWFM